MYTTITILPQWACSHFARNGIVYFIVHENNKDYQMSYLGDQFLVPREREADMTYNKQLYLNLNNSNFTQQL